MKLTAASIPPKNKEAEATHLPIVLLQLIALVLLALHFIVRFLPPTPNAIPEASDAEAAWWGFWPATYVPVWSIIAAAIIVVGSIELLRSWLNTSSQPTTFSPKIFNTLLTLLLLTVAISFFLFPIEHTRWGDAYMLNLGLAWPDPAMRITHSWQAPLDVFLHSKVWLWLHESNGQQNATATYRLLSPIAGILYLLVVGLISRAKWLAPSWLTIGLLTSLGLLQLFFGYIENYSFAAVGILLYLWLALHTLRGQSPLWLTASALALTNATHPSTAVLGLSLLYVGWRVIKEGKIEPNRAVLSIVSPIVIVAASTILLMELGDHGLAALVSTDRPGGGDARWLVPLFETTTRWEHYTLFSWLHLRDFFNEQMLVAPVVLPTLLSLAIAWGVNRKWLNRNQPHVAFLLVASISYLLFTWLWNPDYGGQRDWDLFSLAAIPTTLLLITLLPQAIPDPRKLLAGALPLIVVQALHTAAWVYQNTLPWAWPG